MKYCILMLSLVLYTSCKVTHGEGASNDRVAQHTADSSEISPEPEFEGREDAPAAIAVHATEAARDALAPEGTLGSVLRTKVTITYANFPDSTAASKTKIAVSAKTLNTPQKTGSPDLKKGTLAKSPPRTKKVQETNIASVKTAATKTSHPKKRWGG